MHYRMTAAAVLALALVLAVAYPLYSPVVDRQVQETCPAGCECVLADHTGVRVQCALQSLGKIPQILPANTISLDVSGNPLESLDSSSFAHLSLPFLRKLDLTNTSLNSIAPDTFKHLPKLREVIFNDNNLGVAQITAVWTKSPRVKVHVNGNPRVRCQEVKEMFAKSVVNCETQVGTSTTAPPTPSIHVTASSAPNTTAIQLITEETSTTTVKEHTDTSVSENSGTSLQGLVGINIALWILLVAVVGIAGFLLYRRRAVNTGDNLIAQNQSTEEVSQEEEGILPEETEDED